MKAKNIIDLEKFRSTLNGKKSKVFTGRDRGHDVRERSEIDKIFDNNDSVKFIIPNDIFSITPSFLEELFKNIAKKYSKEEILKKLDLSENEYDLFNSLSEAIDRIKQDKNALQY